MSRPERLLVAKGMSKRFGSVEALLNVDFDVWPGEVVALVGDNGAGKSTLIKAISGVQPADAEELRFDGQPVAIARALLGEPRMVILDERPRRSASCRPRRCSRVRSAPPGTGRRAVVGADARAPDAAHDESMPTAPVHVEPRPGGRWVVRRDADPEPLSEHHNAAAATEAAVESAEGAAEVLIHDIYSRVLPVAPQRSTRKTSSRAER
jgi:hypothetical protein